MYNKENYLLPYSPLNSNYYFIKTTPILKPRSYARELQKHSSVRTMAIPVWTVAALTVTAEQPVLPDILKLSSKNLIGYLYFCIG